MVGVVIGLIVGVVTGIVTLRLWKERQARRRACELGKLLHAASYRSNMDRILDGHDLKRDREPETQLMSEVVAVANLITRKTIEYAGKSIEGLTDEERVLANVVMIVSCDHISRMSVEVSFELSSIACNAGLWAVRLGVDGSGDLLEQTVILHNQLAEEEQDILELIGKRVAGFFDTDDLKYLDSLGKAYGKVWGVKFQERGS